MSMEKLTEKIAQILDTVYSGNQHIGDVYNTEALEQIMKVVMARDAFVIGEICKEAHDNNPDAITPEHFATTKLQERQRKRSEESL